jgi:hypothetical protein
MLNSPYSLISELEKAGVTDGSLPPIHLWHPDHEKDIDMEIQADGSWFYMGSAIKRPRLTKLFSSVMRREGNDYFLVTPVEKCRIQVQDVPFVAILLETGNNALKLTTNMGDHVTLSKDCPLRVTIDPATQEPGLYVTIRAELEAKLNRNVYYQLMELLEEEEWEGELWHGITSRGDFLPIIQSSKL